jgi:serine/threonine protein kinase
MYRIDPKNVLGRGAYGVVYGGVSTRSPKRVVAIKVMLKKDNLEHAGDLKGICSTREQDIDKELEILRQLEHPNIIKFHTFVKGTDGVYYIVMEKADGGDLLHRIVTSGSFIEKEARNTCGTILNALKYIHNKGIAHRDLKPENLLLVGKGNKSVIKIADFGTLHF